MEIGGVDIIFKYNGTYDKFVADTLAVCRQHWPEMIVEFNADPSFFVHNTKDSFIYWECMNNEIEAEKGESDDYQLIHFIYCEEPTMVVDTHWEEKTAAKIVKEVKQLQPQE
jgi:hypothetical protein